MTDSDKQTEEKIFESATEVFIEKGMDGARMQDIANRAGINKALLHYYYRTKDHLFNAVFEKIALKIFRKFAPVFDPGLSLENKIRFFYREHITFLQENPGLPIFVLTEINRNPARIKKLISKIDVNKLWQTLHEQHSEELKNYNISETTIPQLMSSIASISIFPFVARGILEGIFDKIGVDFNQYLEERKEYAADFVIKAIRKSDQIV
jgi:TetR/AcrR family transcriptional regulator